MPIRNILVPLTGGEHDPLALANGFAVAGALGAHLRVLFVRPDPSRAIAFFGDEIVPVVAREIVEASRSSLDEIVANARTAWRSAAARADFPIAEDSTGVNTTAFGEDEGHFTDCVERAAVLADLILFGPLQDGERPSIAQALETVLLNTGRPILLCPQVLPRDFARRIAIGWNGRSGSARAVSAALPFLRAAEEARIITVHNGDNPEDEDALHDYLALHDVESRIVRREAGVSKVGDVLLDAAASSGLLVIGGFGHGRLYELFADGVTRQVLGHTHLPLFLVH